MNSRVVTDAPADPATSADDLVRVLLGDARLTCLVGAGGKKTTLYALARALPGTVALSSTSHMYRYDRRWVQAEVTLAPDSLTWPDMAPARVRAFCGEPGADGRRAGLSEAQVEALCADPGHSRILLKADGARARWIKAPAPYEPIIPAATERVLYLVSAQVIGQVLDARIAHRPERVAEVCGMMPGDRLEALHLGRLLASADGALKGIGRADIVPVINMVDDAVTLAAAREAARHALALTQRFAEVVLACMQHARIVEIVRR